MTEPQEMSTAVEPLSLHCRKCDTTKPASDFYFDYPKRLYCKDCHRRYARERRALAMEEMGEEEFLRRQRERTAASRKRTGNKANKAWNRARSRAISRLIEARRREYDEYMRQELYTEEADT